VCFLEKPRRVIHARQAQVLIASGKQTVSLHQEERGTVRKGRNNQDTAAISSCDALDVE
jgi:hypothetical protein